ADRQRAHRAAWPWGPGRCAGNRLVRPLLFEHSPLLKLARMRSTPLGSGLMKTLHPSFKFLFALTLALAAAVATLPPSAQAARIKELAAVQGVRSNQLIGYGLVVGLDGTGDQTTQTPFTVQSVTAMLQQMGITVPAGAAMQLKNVAAVLVTTSLPPFALPGPALGVNA